MSATGSTRLFGQEWGVVSALWRRDLLRLQRERTRWLGVVLQPLLFWLVIGSGMSHSLQLPDAGGVDYLTYFFPGILVMIVLFTAIFGTMSVIEDRQSGFLQGVLVAPASRTALVLGKTLGVATVVAIQSVLFLLLLPLAGYTYGGVHWLTLSVAILLTSAGLTGVGLMMAWVLRSAQAYHAMMSVVLLPLWIVSGAMFPPHDSGWLGWLMTVNPLTYGVTAIRGAMSGSDAGVATALLVLLGFAVLAVAMASMICRRTSGRAT